MAIMPGASRALKFTGNRHKEAVDKIVLHTTEGGTLPGYAGGGAAPHFTVHRDGRIWQHIDTAQSAKALENRAGGVETNNGGCIQIEFIGSCDRAYAKKNGLFFVPNATDKDLGGLAAVLAWISKTHGVPLTDRGLTWSDSNAAYLTAPQRMSQAKWRSFSGVCGHQHVPENVHWDPGLLPVSRLLALAGGAKVNPWDASPRIQAMSTADVTALQKNLQALGYDLGKYGVDGSYGEATYNAVRKAQKALGVAVDGVAGPDTLAAIAKKVSGKAPAKSPSKPAAAKPAAAKTTVKVDDRFGHDTVKAAQRFLNKVAKAGLKVDGKAGHEFWKAMQDWLGTPVDGVVSNQSHTAASLGNGITQGWDYTGPRSSGSTMVKALQKKIGVTADGVWGPKTSGALQAYLNKHA